MWEHLCVVSKGKEVTMRHSQTSVSQIHWT